MRRLVVVLLVAGLAVAGCTHPAGNPPRGPAATGPSTPAIRGRATRPAGWKAIRYRGLSFSVPATWRVRDGRRFPCPGILPGPAVVLGHSPSVPPCPMPRLRAPLLWIDDRVDDRLPTAAVATSVNGQDIWLLRLHPDNLGQASSDELMYWSQYRRATGFQVWDLGQELKAELLDPAGGAVADQILSTLHRSS
jgi:hypothetical protein